VCMCVLDSRILLYVSSCSLLVYKNCRLLLITACSELHKVLFLALSVTFLFVYEISPELLNGFAPNSHGRRVWSLTQTCLKVKVTRDKKRHFSALLAAYMRFMFGKTSLASSVENVFM